RPAEHLGTRVSGCSRPSNCPPSCRQYSPDYAWHWHKPGCFWWLQNLSPRRWDWGFCSPIHKITVAPTDSSWRSSYWHYWAKSLTPCWASRRNEPLLAGVKIGFVL